MKGFKLSKTNKQIFMENSIAENKELGIVLAENSGKWRFLAIALDQAFSIVYCLRHHRSELLLCFAQQVNGWW